jgi:hypothetical protein
MHAVARATVTSLLRIVCDFKHNERYGDLSPLALSNLGSLSIRSGQELGPTQASLRSPTAIKIPFIRTPSRTGSGMPNHYTGEGYSTV